MHTEAQIHTRIYTLTQFFPMFNGKMGLSYLEGKGSA